MNEEVAFARDVRPLFRDRDVRSMSFAFDLSSYEDVRENGGDLRETCRRNHALRRRLAGRGHRALPHVDRQGVGAMTPGPTQIDRDEVQRLLAEGQAQLVEVLPQAEYEDEHPPAGSGGHGR